MSGSTDLTPDQIALLRDPSNAGPGYDALTQLQMLVDGGYLRRLDDGASYERTPKGDLTLG